MKYKVGDKFKVKETHQFLCSKITKGSLVTVIEAWYEYGCFYYTIQDEKGTILRACILG